MKYIFTLIIIFLISSCSIIPSETSKSRTLQSTVYETNVQRSSPQVVLIGQDIAAIIGGTGQTNSVEQTQVINANTGAISSGPYLVNSRYLFAMNQVDKKRVFVAGGYTLSNGNRSILSSIELVDFNTNVSTIVAYLPKPLADFSSVLVKEQNAIYYVGGETTGGVISSNIYKFNLSTYTITQMSSMAYGRQDHTVNLVGDLIVIIGGFDGTAMAAIEHFNVKNNTCSLAANLRQGRFIHRTIQIDSEKLLICGGYDGSTSIASTEIYNVYNTTVYRGVNLFSAKDAFSIEKLFNGQIVVGGGACNGDTRNEIDIINVENDTIKNAGTLSTPRDAPGSMVLSGDRILYACGYYNGTFLSTVEIVQF